MLENQILCNGLILFQAKNTLEVGKYYLLKGLIILENKTNQKFLLKIDTHVEIFNPKVKQFNIKRHILTNQVHTFV